MSTKTIDQTYEEWSNHDTWYVNLRVVNNRQAYGLMKDGKPYTAKKVKSFVINWAIHIRDHNKEHLFEHIRNFDNVNWQELAEEWNQ